MHVLFIIDPLPTLKAHKDSSVAMMRALVTRGHTLSVALAEDIYIEAGQVKARAIPITLVANSGSKDDASSPQWWQETGEGVEQPLSTFDCVLMRKDPPVDMEYIYTTHLLDYAQAQGAKVYNSGRAIRNHSEKLAITEFVELAPPTLVTSNIARLKAFHAQQQDIIVKPLDGMGGAGIFRLGVKESNFNAILETVTHNGSRTIMAQRYLPEIAQGDKRILLIHGKAVPYALARFPLLGETRANLVAGGQGVAQPLSSQDIEIVNRVAPCLAARGLLLVGLDVIGDKLTEINVTSPTCLVEITQQTGIDVADMFVQALEQIASP